MILYKYVDLETARKILANKTVRFTHTHDLNDPFEATCLLYENETRNYHDRENYFNHIKISMSYGILSLSRSALNPLMWAHYGWGKKLPHNNGIYLGESNKSHGGMVIGIDIDKAGFNNESWNVLPAKFGNVIYTTTKPTNVFSESQSYDLFEGAQYSYDPKLLEALQRVFLYKSSAWSYEEEVRVVRNILKNPLQDFGYRGIQEIPSDSIMEVYIGCGHSHDEKNVTAFYEEIKAYIPSCKIFLCNTRGTTWDINFEEIIF